MVMSPSSAWMSTVAPDVAAAARRSISSVAAAFISAAYALSLHTQSFPLSLMWEPELSMMATPRMHLCVARPLKKDLQT